MTKHRCALCGVNILPQSIAGGSAAFKAEVWITCRNKARGRYFVIRRTGQYAHNACVEMANRPSGTVGQLEMFNEVSS